MSIINRFGHNELFRESCVNSMNWAKTVLHEQPHGTLLFANSHHNARGRHGRTWCIMPGQLLLTYIVKPTDTSTICTDDEHGASPLLYLYYALNVGLCAAIRRSCPEVRIKWPNDCLLAGKKVSGMLLEPVWSGEQLIGMALGIGLNVNNKFSKQHELRPYATSMRTYKEKIKPFELQPVLTTVNEELTTWYEQWHNGNYQHIWDTWQQYHIEKGSVVTVHKKDGTTISGSVHDLAINGDITLQNDDGLCTVSIIDSTSMPFNQ